MLSDNAFFSGVGAEALVRVLPAFRVVTLPPHTFLYVDGRVARHVFLIVSGSVALIQRSGGVATTVALLGPGEFTGERALLQPATCYPWSAVCCEATRVALADADAIGAAFATLPALGVNVARALHRRVHDAALAIDALIAGP